MSLDLESYMLGKKSGGGGGGETINYNDLSNQPSINGVTLSGNKTSEDLGIETGAAAEITIDLQHLNSSELLGKVGELISNNIDQVVKVYVVDGSMYMSEGYIHVINLLNNYTPVASYAGNFGESYTTVQISGAWDNTRTEYTVSSLQTATLNIKKALPVDNTITYTPTQATHPATKGYVDSAIEASGGEHIQYSTMPTASADTLGKIVQYTGTTDSTYTNGYFYIGVSDGQDPATYSWERTAVQPEVEIPEKVYNVFVIENNYNYFSFNWQQLGGAITVNGGNALNDLKNQLTAIFQKAYNNKVLYILLISKVQYGNGLFAFSNAYPVDSPISYKPTSVTFGVDNFYSRSDIADSAPIYGRAGNIVVNLSWNGDIVTVTNVSSGSVQEKILITPANTYQYTPTSDYNPATKKYVDDQPTTYSGYDATKTQVLKNVNGILTWVDES